MIAPRSPLPTSASADETDRAAVAHGFTGEPADEAPFSAIPDAVRGLQTVLAAVVGAQGRLKDCNRGFLALMPRDGDGALPTDVRSLFVSPDFEVLRRRPQDPFEGCAYRGPLSVAQGRGRTLSLSAIVFRHGSDLLLLAEYDFTSIDRWRTTILDLQAELSVRQHRIDSLQGEVSRLRSMLEAAMRDRDTLLDALAAPARK